LRCVLRRTNPPEEEEAAIRAAAETADDDRGGLETVGEHEKPPEAPYPPSQPTPIGVDTVDEKGEETGVTEDLVSEAIPQGDMHFVWNYCRYAAAQTDAPMGYHVGIAYPIVAVTAPAGLHLPGLAGGPVIANFWSLLVGRSGWERKTSAIRIGERVLTDATQGLVQGGEISAQALEQQVIENPVQLRVYTEFGDFLSRARAGSVLQPVKAALTKLYDGTAVQRKSARRPKKEEEAPVDEAKMPRVSLLAGITPEYLQAYMELEDLYGGFLSRPFTLNCRRRRTYQRDRTTAPFYVALRQWLVYWLKASWELQTAAPCLGFDEDSWAIWIDWQHGFESRCKGLGRLTGQVARVSTQAAKIALLNWYCRCGMATEGSYLPPCDLVPAIRLAELHLCSLMELSHLLHASRDMREKQLVLELLPIGQPIALGALILRANLLKRRVEALLETLRAEERVFPLQGTDQRCYLVRHW